MALSFDYSSNAIGISTQVNEESLSIGINTVITLVDYNSVSSLQLHGYILDTSGNIGSGNSVLVGSGSGVVWVQGADPNAIVSLDIQEEGSYLGGVIGLNFVGSNVTASVAGTISTITYSSNPIFTGLTVNGDSYLNGNLNVRDNVTIGGTTVQLNAQQLVISDPDIIVGLGTTFSPTDFTASHGGIAVASTEGYPLVNLSGVAGETLPNTYKKIMWFRGSDIGVGITDAWLINYAVGIGSTQVPTGVRLAAGGMQVTDSNISSPNINVSDTAVINKLDVNQISPDGVSFGTTSYVPIANGSGGWGWGPVSAAGAATTNAININDEGIYKGYATTLNFVGAAITASVSGDTATVTLDIASVQGGQGVQGLQGTQGLQGLQGTQGTQGLQGLQGTQGLQGLQGTQGTQGLQGTQGTQGLQGLQGTQGTQGLQGFQGTQGVQGLQGSNNGGVTIIDDTSTNSNWYVAISSVTSGIQTSLRVSSNKFQINPSTGALGIGTAIDIIPYDTLNSGTLSWEGSAGQLFSITNNLTTGSIFSVNDVTGIPSIDVDADGTIQFGAYGGNIGVGTTSPTQKLDVVGNIRLRNGLYDVYNQVGTANSILISTGVGVSWTTPYAAGLQGVQGTQGTQGRQGLQGVQGISIQGIQGASGGGGGGSIAVTNDTSTNSTYYVGYSTVTSGNLSSLGISSTKLQFNPSTGALGIGTAIDIVPYDTLNSGTLSFVGSSGQLFSVTNNLTSGSIFAVNDVSGVPSIDVNADGTIQLGPYGGNVGIGITNPTSKLYVSGDGYFTGNVYGLTFTSLSDKNLKKNIRSIENPLTIINSMNGVYYDWIDDNNPTSVGLIAQEVEKVLPQVISTNDKGLKTISYGNIVAVLIEAIKEQQIRIEKLEDRLNA